MWRSPYILAGGAIWLLCLMAWGVVWIFEPGAAVAMGACFAAFLLGGKLAGIPTGLALGLPAVVVGAVVCVPDAGAVLVTYPLLGRGWEIAGRWSLVLARLGERSRAQANRRRGVVARFGSYGLLLFSLTPVAFISPIVVSAIGQLMGLRARRVLVPVLSGMAILTGALVVGFKIGIDAARRVHPALPFVVTGLILALFASRELVLRWRKRTARARTQT